MAEQQPTWKSLENVTAKRIFEQRCRDVERHYEWMRRLSKRPSIIDEIARARAKG